MNGASITIRTCAVSGARGGDRTRDPQLGKAQGYPEVTRTYSSCSASSGTQRHRRRLPALSGSRFGHPPYPPKNHPLHINWHPPAHFFPVGSTLSHSCVYFVDVDSSAPPTLMGLELPHLIQPKNKKGQPSQMDWPRSSIIGDPCQREHLTKRAAPMPRWE